MPSDDKSKSSSVGTYMTNEEHQQMLTEGAIKTVAVYLDESGKYNHVAYQGATDLTLLEAIKAWTQLTNWLLNMSNGMTSEAGDDVESYVLQTLVKKITHECEVKRAKTEKDKPSIIV